MCTGPTVAFPRVLVHWAQTPTFNVYPRSLNVTSRGCAWWMRLPYVRCVWLVLGWSYCESVIIFFFRFPSLLDGSLARCEPMRTAWFMKEFSESSIY